MILQPKDAWRPKHVVDDLMSKQEERIQGLGWSCGTFFSRFCLGLAGHTVDSSGMMRKIFGEDAASSSGGNATFAGAASSSGGNATFAGAASSSGGNATFAGAASSSGGNAIFADAASSSGGNATFADRAASSQGKKKKNKIPSPTAHVEPEWARIGAFNCEAWPHGCKLSATLQQKGEQRTQEYVFLWACSQHCDRCARYLLDEVKVSITCKSTNMNGKKWAMKGEDSAKKRKFIEFWDQYVWNEQS